MLLLILLLSLRGVAGDALLLCRSFLVQYVNDIMTSLSTQIPAAQLEQQRRRRCVVVVQANGDDSRYVRTAVLSTGCENCTAAQNNSRGVTHQFFFGWRMLIIVVDVVWSRYVMLYMRPCPQLCVLSILGAAS